MKKNLFFVAAAALMLASCSNDVKLDENIVPVGSNKQQEIGFFALSKKPNRKPAAAISDGTFPTAIPMKIAAYNVTAGADFFGATTFSYADSKWTGGKYWPLEVATINFLAIANANANNETGVTWGTDEDENSVYENFASKVAIVMSDNSEDQRDLMYAVGTGSVTKPSTVLVYPSPVALAFRHAQAWIHFTVKASDASSASAITINKITLNDVSCAGTYTVTYSNYNVAAAASVAGVWSAYDAAEDDVDAVVATGYSALSDSEQAYGDLMVIPDQGMTSFTVNYTIDGNAYNFTYTPAPALSLAQATKYTFNITLSSLHAIEVAPTVTTWADGGENDVDQE